MTNDAHRLALRAVPFDALTSAELQRWTELRHGSPMGDSPYFHPGFAAAVNGCGRPVTVVVGSDPVGVPQVFLAVHRAGSRAIPAGSPAADFQGPVQHRDAVLDPAAVLRVLGVRSFAFDHLVGAGDAFGPWVEGTRTSPLIDVTGGLEGYLERASRSGRDNMGQARRRARKAERELGGLRFDADCRDPAVLDRVIALKRAQYAATGAHDYFADPRHRALAHELLGATAPEFGGSMATLHAGDTLLAGHFGLRSGPILHWWFPVYDPDLARLGPGWLLLRALVESAPGTGIERIDLGRGEDEYKRRAMTGATSVRQGLVSGSVVGRRVRRIRRAAEAAARSSRVGPGLVAAARRLRRARG